MIKRKIMEAPPEGKGWSEDQTAEAELWYRRYLELCARYPDVPVVPNYPIDMMWHQHILDTVAYRNDCDAIFGEPLDHFPYFGLRGPEDAENRDNAFDVTNELYRRHFGEDCTTMRTLQRRLIPQDCITADGNEFTRANNVERVGDPAELVAAGYPGDNDRAYDVGYAANGLNCCSGGSGTGCGQGCRRGG